LAGWTDSRFRDNGLKTINNMRVKDFEKAIDELGGVTIDSMNLRGGHVRMCLAHTKSELLKFDSFGRAFAVGLGHCPVSREDHEVYDEDEYGLRVPKYDLQFG